MGRYGHHHTDSSLYSAGRRWVVPSGDDGRVACVAPACALNPALTDTGVPAPALSKAPFSTHFGATPPRNESASTVEPSAPMVQVSSPVPGTPEQAIRMPVVLAEVPFPVFRIPAPGSKASALSLQLSTPTHFGAALIQNEPALIVQVSASIVQESAPVVQESTSIVQVSASTVQESALAVQESIPTVGQVARAGAEAAGRLPPSEKRGRRFS